jgi:LmbE family N-acetylglucosaminyl deacetylase
LIEALRTSSREAAKLLGLQEISFYGLPDNRFDTIALLDIIKIVEEIIDRFHPAVIYTHHSGDLNIDHSMVCRAVLTATRPMQSQPVKEIYSFETPSSTEWAFHQYEPAFHPNVFVNIFDTLDLKIRAFSSYETEGRPFPHPRSAVAIRAIAQRWGSTVGCEAAEAFELIRGIKF